MSPPPTAPLPASALPPAPGPVHGLPDPLRAPTLLLVEDSRFAAESVRLICRRAGLRLRRAETLADATRHLAVYRPDIALVDLGLPDGSGLVLIERLDRQVPRLARIVAISGDPSLETAARHAGADGFIDKPLCLSAHLAILFGGAVDLGEPAEVADHALGLPARRPAGSTAAAPDARPGLARNMGADPLALCDDLQRARALLSAAANPERIGHAAQFLSGIARSLDDRPLFAQAERTRQSGEPGPLLALLEHRLAAQTPLGL